MSDAVYASATAATPLTTRSYSYYPTGALKSVSEGGVTLSYTYDERGNCTSESDGEIIKTYVYNDADLRSSDELMVKAGETNIIMANAQYTYNVLWQLCGVETGHSTTAYSYDRNGNRIAEQTAVPNGHQSSTSYSYDGANRVVSLLTTQGSGNTAVVNESYAYNLDGSMRTKVSGGVTTGYTYDGAGRLSSEGNGVISVTYGYDAANNRTSMNVGGVVTTYAYDANNRLLSESKAGTVKSYTYDANGNQLTDDGATYTYNARGQQASYSKDGVTASYTYLPTGLRKSKTVGGTTTTFVWDGANMVYEYTGTNATGGKAYYYGLTLISQGNAAYYLYNGHGDVVQLVTSTGTLGRSYDYDAFGNEVSPSAGDTNPFRYAGQYYDTETGTYYLRARYYNPSIGRFTQQDGWAYANPRDPLSLNLYTYCWNNPLKYVDITGESPRDVFAGFILAIDDGVIGGFSQWVVRKLKGQNAGYQQENDADFYLGRVLGDLVSMFLGAGMTAKGLTDIIAAISGGAAVTVGTAGAGSGGGVAIAVGGVIVGTVEIGTGGIAMYAAASNLGDDYQHYKFSKQSEPNWKKVSEKYLEKKLAEYDLDPHALKYEYLGKNAKISQYNIYVDKNTGQLAIFDNKGNLCAITEYFIK